MGEEGKRIINRLEEGVVIDHVLPRQSPVIAEDLGLYKRARGTVIVADKLVSPSIGVKGLIKVQGIYLTDDELNRVALYSPDATVSRIFEGEVVEKRQVEIPENLEGLIDCPNPNCVSVDSGERLISSFKYNRETEHFTCGYCSYSFSREEILLNPG